MSEYSYDRSKEAMSVAWHLPAQADESLGKAYQALLGFKGSVDQMQEIPPDLQKLYNIAMKAMNEVGEARQQTHQLRELVKRQVR